MTAFVAPRAGHWACLAAVALLVADVAHGHLLGWLGIRILKFEFETAVCLVAPACTVRAEEAFLRPVELVAALLALQVATANRLPARLAATAALAYILIAWLSLLWLWRRRFYDLKASRQLARACVIFLETV